MSNEANWHLLTAEGEQMGPYTGEELLAFAGEGRITPECLVWAEGSDDWVSAAQVEGLFPAPPAGAPRLITGAAAVPAQAVPIAAPVAPLSAPVVVSPPSGTALAGGSTGTRADAFHPAFVGSLRRVALGLGFLLWGTWLIVGGLVLVAVGAASAFFGAASSGSGDGDMTFELVALVAGGGLMLLGSVSRIVGESISIAVPFASGARGFMIACLCCDAGSLLISLLGIPLGGLLNSAGLILIALFLRKLATFTGNMVQAIAAKSLIIHSAILVGLSVTLPILVILVFGAGLAIGMSSGSGLAGFGVGAIVLLVLLVVSIFFALSVLIRSIALFRDLRNDIRSRCFRTMAAMRHAQAA